ncbi:helix-turn-helix domain-containing protein [Myxococcota bacterium]|nr:helix-turn-helix domain-containing protein [Myxococcota bacterium]
MGPKDLAAARIAAGYTQRQLAERLGTTTATVSRWETGERAISLAAAQEWARCCGGDLLLNLPNGVAEHVDPLERDLVELLPVLDAERRSDLAVLVAHWRIVKKL